MNLLFVFSDQQRYSALGANGNRVVQTRWMEGTDDPFEFGRRGPRGFIDVGQRWTDPARWKDWGTA